MRFDWLRERWSRGVAAEVLNLSSCLQPPLLSWKKVVVLLIYSMAVF